MKLYFDPVEVKVVSYPWILNTLASSRRPKGSLQDVRTLQVFRGWQVPDLHADHQGQRRLQELSLHPLQVTSLEKNSRNFSTTFTILSPMRRCWSLILDKIQSSAWRQAFFKTGFVSVTLTDRKEASSNNRHLGTIDFLRYPSFLRQIIDTHTLAKWQPKASQ